MYSGTTINPVQQHINTRRYLFALHAWNDMRITERQKLLKELSHNTILAHRTFPFIPRNVRQNLIDLLNSRGR